PNCTIVYSPSRERLNVRSVPTHSSGPDVKRQCTFLFGFNAMTSMVMRPISFPSAEWKRTSIFPPILDEPDVCFVHQPATPSTVDNAEYTFATGALIPTL